MKKMTRLQIHGGHVWISASSQLLGQQILLPPSYPTVSATCGTQTTALPFMSLTKDGWRKRNLNHGHQVLPKRRKRWQWHGYPTRKGRHCYRWAPSWPNESLPLSHSFLDISRTAKRKMKTWREGERRRGGQKNDFQFSFIWISVLTLLSWFFESQCGISG